MRRISSQVHLTYWSKRIPPIIERRWRELNAGCSIKVHEDEECYQFLTREYGAEYGDWFVRIPSGPIKADWWRVCYLYRFGGVYADLDLVPLISLHDVFHDQTTIGTCLALDRRSVFQAIIAASPGNPVLAECIDLMLRRFSDNEHRIEHIEFPNEHFRFFSGTHDLYLALQRFLGTTEPIEANRFYRQGDQTIQILDEHKDPDKEDWRHCIVTFKGKRCFKSRDIDIVDFMGGA